jgi:hypothetical protein
MKVVLLVLLLAAVAYATQEVQSYHKDSSSLIEQLDELPLAILRLILAIILLSILSGLPQLVVFALVLVAPDVIPFIAGFFGGSIGHLVDVIVIAARRG